MGLWRLVSLDNLCDNLDNLFQIICLIIRPACYLRLNLSLFNNNRPMIIELMFMMTNFITYYLTKVNRLFLVNLILKFNSKNFKFSFLQPIARLE